MRGLALVFPRFHYPSGDYPLGIASLAAWLRERLPLRVSILDTTFQPDMAAVAAFLDREAPDFVGIGMSTLMVPEGLEIARLAHVRGARVIVGGPHPTIDPQGMLEDPAVDAVVLGEGELATEALLRAWLRGDGGPVPGCFVKDGQGRIYASAERSFIQDLDSLPFPAWDLLDIEAYVRAWGQMDIVQPGLRGLNVSSARGCPFSCAFCQPVLDSLFGAHLRLRSPARVVEEIGELRRRHGIQGFWFTDDTFTVRREWVEAFCQLLEDREPGLTWGCTTRANLVDRALLERMARAGCRRMGVGLESASHRIREGIYHKGVALESVAETLREARRLGIRTLLFLMLGAPGETLAEMWETVVVASRLGADEATFSLFVPIPGTRLHAEMKSQGHRFPQDLSRYDYYARQPFGTPLGALGARWIQRLGYARFYGVPGRWPGVIRAVAHPQARRGLLRKLTRIHPG